MKRPSFLFAFLIIAAACSSVDPLDVPVEPDSPEEPPVLRSIVCACDDVELEEDLTVAVELRVEPAGAEVVPTAFGLIDAQSGEPAADFTFYPTGEMDPSAGIYLMRIAYKGTERKFRRRLRAVYDGGELQSGVLTVRASSYTPVVYLRTQAPVSDKENWIGGTIRIDGGNRFEDLAETEVSVRGRGNSTWAWEKKPYALKLARKQEILGMPEHKRWCLIANYMDRTHLRNRIAYYLGANSKLDYTTRNEFVEVYLNEAYQGCYLLTEQIKVGPNRVNVSEEDGFLLEFDTYYDEEVRFRSSASEIPVNVKFPDPEDLSQTRLAALEEYVNRADEAVRALRSGTAGEDPFAYLDRESMIDYWIIFELMANHEMLHPKSVYFHKEGDGKLVAGPIWDFDFETLADHRRTGWINFGAENGSLGWMPWSRDNWWNVLLQHDASLRASLRCRWKEWYPFLRSVPDFIRLQRKSIAAAVARDNRRWPVIHAGNENGDLSLTFEQAAERLESVYRERLEWIDRGISEW